MKGGVLFLIEIPEKKIDGNSLNGLSLAFIGDAVYEILVREHLLEHGSLQVGKLHKMAVEMVRASFQAKFGSKWVHRVQGFILNLKHPCFYAVCSSTDDSQNDTYLPLFQ